MIKLITSALQPSLCSASEQQSKPLRLGLFQMRWDSDPKAHVARLQEGVATCAHAGAELVFLPELTLSRYPADKRPQDDKDRQPERLEDGPTVAFAQAAARANDVFVQVSLYEQADRDDG